MGTPHTSRASKSTALQEVILQMQTQLTQAQTEVAMGRVADLGLSPEANMGRYVSLTRQLSSRQKITGINNVVATRSSATDSAMSVLGLSNLNQGAVQAVTAAASELTGLQASIGTMQSQVTIANSQRSSQANVLTTQIANLDAVDPYEASTRVNDLTTQIETAYSLTEQLHGLSLVNYL